MNVTYILELALIFSFAVVTLLWTIKKVKKEKDYPVAK
jgi:hypothetical protein